MSQLKSFSARNASLNAFLFADIGIEQNGSVLTILSTLARLDKDPWEEARRLSNEPTTTAIELLTKSIASMPLGTEAVDNARSIAVRLIKLLPKAYVIPSHNIAPSDSGLSAISSSQWIIVVCIGFFLAMNASLAFSPNFNTPVTPAVSKPFIITPPIN